MNKTFRFFWILDFIRIFSNFSNIFENTIFNHPENSWLWCRILLQKHIRNSYRFVNLSIFWKKFKNVKKKKIEKIHMET